jgi:hypothetical protein
VKGDQASFIGVSRASGKKMHAEPPARKSQENALR